MQNELLLDLEIIEEDNILNYEQAQRKVQLQVEILKLLEDEELYLFRRSQSTWLSQGNNNTEYFRLMAKEKI